ncbi:YicC/YloC family endoribonuclease [Gilvimarinus sp. SDUM040013]|uniref:YicC/YloC family endoribonuclease n=1 Tax=Gilvimarinus gilvus TaxID=3058038 RepID=A0ABU4RUK2_9GAMM|nr:YicC/YloC family endoribonuclease [Gilvimarinus sp. SDUM040013]MDO3388586.1 YicC/YloC family endoribonuclease [Gilvimarinus sp. SDUM040013]MDX6848542.1 YicC/YloC family endoribonuclease [Gilvimarinus sp. SDUM040013]
MPRSMTGFARLESKQTDYTLTWEVRSVNHRYLEMHLRLGDDFREIEPKLREIIRTKLQRGKLEVTINFQPEQASAGKIGLDSERLAQLADACTRIDAQVPNCAAINPLEVLRWPGVQVTQEMDRESLHASALALFSDTLDQLVEHRAREGNELASFIEQRLVSIAEHVAQLRERMPEILQAQRDKLAEKIAALQVELDPDRLEQEIVMMAQKADVDEELDRLDTHVQEVRRTLKQKNSLGRRLDFLMQELNREANTLSSKSVVSETTQAAVELKVLIEQMREQVQNIE